MIDNTPAVMTGTYVYDTALTITAKTCALMSGDKVCIRWLLAPETAFLRTVIGMPGSTDCSPSIALFWKTDHEIARASAMPRFCARDMKPAASVVRSLVILI